MILFGPRPAVDAIWLFVWKPWPISFFVPFGVLFKLTFVVFEYTLPLVETYFKLLLVFE